MTDLLLTLGLLAAAAGAGWWLRDLRPVPARPATRAEAARLGVVIPARDEERALPAALAPLLDLPVAEVVVVDDDSADATATVARTAGARVLPAGSPPPGWTGKAWACHVGVGATEAELLLFLDADTVLTPDALGGLLDLHGHHGGLVSVQPYHQVRRAHEQLSAYFNVVALLASGAFARRPASRPMAFGPCLLTSRSDYERAGGHAEVRGDILDDVGLAAAYRRAGLPVWCAIGGRSLRMRSYPAGLSQLVAGWTKNFASGASATDRRAAAAAVLWVGAHHAVAVGAVLAALHAATGSGGALVHGHPLLWAAGWAGAAWQLRSFLRRAGSFRWWTWAAFPLPLLAFDVIFARSAALTVVRRSVPWRGREVDLRGPGSTEEAA
jgi:4,4'-diaponeurosporenoate glycosyltransferase